MCVWEWFCVHMPVCMNERQSEREQQTFFLLTFCKDWTCVDCVWPYAVVWHVASSGFILSFSEMHILVSVAEDVGACTGAHKWKAKKQKTFTQRHSHLGAIWHLTRTPMDCGTCKRHTEISCVNLELNQDRSNSVNRCTTVLPSTELQV